MPVAQRQKQRSVEQDRKPRIKPTCLQSTNPMATEARTYNREKTVPSINDAMKPGQPHGKE